MKKRQLSEPRETIDLIESNLFNEHEATEAPRGKAACFWSPPSLVAEKT